MSSPKKIKRPGHPTLYRPEYCELLITHFKSGKSYAAFAALCNVHRDTLHAWEKQEPAFSDAKKIGWEHYQAYWEQIGQDGVYNQTFKDEDGTRTVSLNAAVWIYNMKCRFRKDWHDEQKTETKVTVKADDEQTLKELVDWLIRVKDIK